ncbi:hypothetical protein D9M72_602190 [compost metagenome]
MGDLVPGSDNRFTRGCMGLDRPAGNEEGRLEVQRIQQFEDLCDSDPGVVAAE